MIHPHHERYAIQWGLIGVLAVAGIAWALWSSRPPAYHTEIPAISAEEGAGWFLVIRIPEVPPNELDAAAARTQVAGWLAKLREAGFWPMRLSTVLSRLNRGESLPPRTVVLLFHPGYRHTYETLAPVFEEHRCPVVWLTDRKAVRHADRRYLSQHALRNLEASDLWDVGWYESSSDAKALRFELAQWTPARGWPRSFLLNLQAGHLALNRTNGTRSLVRLNVVPTWTAQDLVDRLLAEAPIDGPAYLTARLIGSRMWGIGLDADADASSPPFTVEAPLDSRAASVSWSGTLGTPDLLLNLNLVSRSGELWLLLRSDQRGQALRIGFTDEAILIEQDHENRRTQLASVSTTSLLNSPMNAVVRLQDRSLELSINDEPVITLEDRLTPASPDGIVELVAYDKVRGAAAVDVAALVFQPLGERAHEQRIAQQQARAQ